MSAVLPTSRHHKSLLPYPNCTSNLSDLAMRIQAYRFLLAVSKDGELSSTTLTAQEKSQIRRAQVRKAQIQHRQRKANYVKELELDVVRLRTLVTQTEKEIGVLRRNNEAMRIRIRAAGVGVPFWRRRQQSQSQGQQQQQDTDTDMPLRPQAQAGEVPLDNVDLFAEIDINNMEVTLSMDDIMGTPTYKISPVASSASSQSARSPGSEGSAQMTSEEETAAINFILALEHVCWEHFTPGDFPDSGDPSTHESGHTLMASTFCMCSAPESVYDDRSRFKKAKSKSPTDPATSLTWKSCGLNLQNLHHLATALNPSDKELTPVQAWFELASQYHHSILLDPLTIQALKRELLGVVKCIRIGAVMERQAFESVIGRIIDPIIQSSPEPTAVF